VHHQFGVTKCENKDRSFHAIAIPQLHFSIPPHRTPQKETSSPFPQSELICFKEAPLEINHQPSSIYCPSNSLAPGLAPGLAPLFV